MAPNTIQSDRGNALLNQITFGRGGIQNGTENGRVHLSSTFGNNVLFIDGDGVSRLRFAPGTTVRLIGGLYSQDHVDGVVTAGTERVFDYTFAVAANGVITSTPNVAPVGFTVTVNTVADGQFPSGVADRLVTITGTGAAANRRFIADLQIQAQSGIAPAASMRNVASAATVQGGRY